MLVERIDPDWQWTRYRKVELSRDDGPRLSFSSKYRPASEAATLHRSLAKAFSDQRFKTTEIKDRQLRRSRRKEFLEHWLTSFGKLTADEISDDVKNEFAPQFKGEFPSNDVMGKIQIQFDEFHFNKEAGFVWWIVQVFDVLRSNNMDPAQVKDSDASGTMLDVPNPAQVASDDDGFFPFQRAVLDPLPAPVLDGTVNDHSSYIQRNISRTQEIWSVNYFELLEVLGLTISQKLEGGIKLTFELLDHDSMPVVKVENPLDYMHKIDEVIQPKDLLSYIWILCAEELTELANIRTV